MMMKRFFLLAMLLPGIAWAAGTALTSTSIQYLWDDYQGVYNAPWEKNNQTRFWWNPHTAQWDGVLHKTDGPSDDNAYITTDITGAITFEIQTEGRSTARPDIFWDPNFSGTEPKGKLWVFHSHASTSQLDVYTYNTATDTYSELTTNNAATGIDHHRTLRPACMGVSENGYVWAAVLNDIGLRVQRSTNDGASWSTVYTINGTPGNGVCEVVAFNDGANDRIGIIGSEDGNALNNTLYFYHIIQTADPTSGANWSAENQTVPSAVDSDDHLNAFSHDNVTYIAMKTQDGSSTDPLWVLWVRTAAGAWSNHKVFDHREVHDPTRAQIAYDETNDEIYFAFVQDTGTTWNDGYWTKAAVSDLDTWDTPTLILQDGPGVFRDIYVPQSPVNSSTNIMFLGDNDSDYKIWYNTANIVGVVAAGTPPGLFQRQVHGLRR